jgi:phospholipid-binding lipoprotein MlaA
VCLERAAGALCLWSLLVTGTALAWAEEVGREPGPAREPVALSADDPLFDEDDTPVNDPLEDSNRAILTFNDGAARVLWRPLGRGYRFVVPAVARQALTRVIWNLDGPSIVVNDALQGRFRDSAQTLGRFVVNSTAGVVGLFDPAAGAGWPRHEADFGQTLGRWGIGPGPYLMVPFIGPTSVRDGLGGVVDSFMNPVTYVIGPGGSLVLGSLFLNFGRGIALHERHRDELDALQEGAVDYYLVLRSVYMQAREAFVQGELPELSDTAGVDEDDGWSRPTHGDPWRRPSRQGRPGTARWRRT